MLILLFFVSLAQAGEKQAPPVTMNATNTTCLNLETPKKGGLTPVEWTGIGFSIFSGVLALGIVALIVYQQVFRGKKRQWQNEPSTRGSELGEMPAMSSPKRKKEKVRKPQKIHTSTVRTRQATELESPPVYTIGTSSRTRL